MSDGWVVAEIVVCGLAALLTFVYVGWALRLMRRRSERRIEILNGRRERLVEDLWWGLREAEARHALALRGGRLGWSRVASEVIAEATDEYLAAGDGRLRKAVA